MPPSAEYQDPTPATAPQVQCLVCTRLPTHAHYCHFYTAENHRDTPEFKVFLYESTQDHKSSPLAHNQSPMMAIVYNRPELLNQENWDPQNQENSILFSQSLLSRFKEASAEDQLTHGVPAFLLQHDLNTQMNNDTEPVLVRIHSSCFTGESLFSCRCDCGPQLAQSMHEIYKAGRGVIIYLPQEGRGIGLLEKLKAYNLQDAGHDTVSANLHLNHPVDARDYAHGVEILRDLGIHRVRLMTNNPDKVAQLQRYGITVVDRVPIQPCCSASNHSTHVHSTTTPADHSSSSPSTLSRPNMLQNKNDGTTSQTDFPPQSHRSDVYRYLRTKADQLGHWLYLD